MRNITKVSFYSLRSIAQSQTSSRIPHTFIYNSLVYCSALFEADHLQLIQRERATESLHYPYFKIFVLVTCLSLINLRFYPWFLVTVKLLSSLLWPFYYS